MSDAGEITLVWDAAHLERELESRRSSSITAGEAKYLAELLRAGPERFVQNAGPIRVAIAVGDTTVWPLVINDGRARDCYLVSPFVHYIAYMLVEVRKMKPLAVSLALRSLLHSLGVAFRALQFDRFVSINNWLFTTSPTTRPTTGELASLQRTLRRRFPAHALVYRGVDPANAALAEALDACGFARLIHRPVFEWSFQRKLSRNQRRNVRVDLALTERGPYRAARARELTPAQASTVARLYERLYIEKHSAYNARFTADYFAAFVNTGAGSLDWLIAGDEPVGFVTTYADRERIVAALVGYEQTREAGYRALVAVCLRRAIEEQRPLFLSTGVAAFKRARGAVEAMEYEAFDVSHLPRPRQLPWLTMKKFLDAAIAHMDTGSL